MVLSSIQSNRTKDNSFFPGGKPGRSDNQALQFYPWGEGRLKNITSGCVVGVWPHLVFCMEAEVAYTSKITCKEEMQRQNTSPTYTSVSESHY